MKIDVDIKKIWNSILKAIRSFIDEEHTCNCKVCKRCENLSDERKDDPNEK